MTGFDYPDYTQPVALAEQITQLTSPGQTISVGAPSTVLDTSAVSNVSVLITPPSVLAGNKFYLALRWQNGADVLDYRALTFHDNLGYAIAVNPLVVQMPVRATTLVLGLSGVAGTACPLTVYGSTRQINDITVSRQAFGAATLLAHSNTLTVAAGATQGPFYVPPSTDLVRFDTNFIGTKMLYSISGVSFVGGVSAVLLRSGNSDGLVPFSDEFSAPLTGLQYTVQNTDTVGHTFNVNVWDVSR